jgi:acetyl esterase/lipase
MKEINFFGLLLRMSKDFLIPNYNVILHVHGGGFLSQSSESHLSYLTRYFFNFLFLVGQRIQIV